MRLFGKKIHSKIAVLSISLVSLVTIFGLILSVAAWKRTNQQQQFEILGNLSEHVAILFSSLNNAKHYCYGYARSKDLFDEVNTVCLLYTSDAADE